MRRNAKNNVRSQEEMYEQIDIAFFLTAQLPEVIVDFHHICLNPQLHGKPIGSSDERLCPELQDYMLNGASFSLLQLLVPISATDVMDGMDGMD